MADAIDLGMSLKTDELKNRIEAKKHELLASVAEAKADTRAEAAQGREKAKIKLSQLEEYLKDGWDRMSDQVAAKLNDWLKS